MDMPAGMDFFQILQSGKNASRIFTRNTRLPDSLGTDGNVEGLESHTPHLRNGQKFSDFCAGLESYAKFPEYFDFFFEYILTEAEIRCPQREHTAQAGLFFIYGNLMAHLGQIICAGESCRAGSDYCHLFAF